jgi:hypothetical protein
MREGLILLDGSESVAHLHVDIPVGKGGMS